MTHAARSALAFVLAPLLLLTPATHADAPATLRVCADPNNLPFSNRRGEGFENRLAALLAADLGLALDYHWSAQRRGFIRNTLKAKRCDVILGVPSELDMLLTSEPYYRSSYVFVIRRERWQGPMLGSLDDPRLRTLRVGVPVVGDDYANPPPAHALARRGIVDNVVGYSVFGDYGQDSPPLDLLRALLRGEIDVAIAWGPLAGYMAAQKPGSLQLTPVQPREDGPQPFTFAISLGVRKEDVALRDQLAAALKRNRPRVEELLHAFGFPVL